MLTCKSIYTILSKYFMRFKSKPAVCAIIITMIIDTMSDSVDYLIIAIL